MNRPIDFSYIAREQKENYHEIITTLGTSISKMVESSGKGNGCLIFFPSYLVMKECIDVWNNNDITFNKTLRFEDKDPNEMQRIFQLHINDCTGQ